MNRILAALALALSAPVWAAPAPGSWEKEIAAFEAADAKSPPPADAALFIGSSSIRGWRTLARDFPDIPVINRGFGGSQLPDSTRFLDRIVFPCRPRVIVMYAGTNDISAGRSPEQVYNDFRVFVAAARSGLPDVPILYISINPNILRWAQRERQIKANRLIAAFTRGKPGLHFIDSWPAFLAPDGLPEKSLLVSDNLHLSAAGYTVWTRNVRPTVLQVYAATSPRAPAR